MKKIFTPKKSLLAGILLLVLVCSGVLLTRDNKNPKRSKHLNRFL